MPCPKKKSTTAKKINRLASSGAFIKKIQLENEDYVDLEFDHEDGIVLDNRELQGMSEEVTSAAYTNQILKWHEGADKSICGTYQKNSQTTEWRKRKADNDASNTQESYSLTDTGFFIKVQKEAPIELKESIDSKLENIQIDKIAVLKLAHEDVKKEIFPYTRAGPSSKCQNYGSLRKSINGNMASQKHLLSSCYKKSTICKWIQNQRPESRSLIKVKMYIDGEILPRKFGISGNSFTSTIWKYLHEWDYVFRENSKDIYYNGHEREDLIAYHQKWAKRMIVSNEIQHVLVTHDELTFYTNNGKNIMWLMEDENQISKKDLEMSLMIKVFRPRADRDGYWMSADMLKQLKNNIIPLFELFHPECNAVFSFDQSTNHRVKMKLNDNEIKDNNPCSLQDTVFVQNDQLDCKSKDTYEDSKCCAHHFLASQPDFMSQKTALYEAVKDSGHIFELYPKFHCKCN
ncbi:hypothetical protein PHYBLDRAFT_171043 [Phycomyces blakesleeanus NRRL 1555(-)]|uniref:Uncharacterized protein n=1 Tax=Phycomyces blakesleeanus (strain ATCC 8743b / DSM 1359 / FGSC 10004 / NBRC 33097 / NRRL 1555) TaxID=763407 RepID=A0A162TZ25_PHYB8|nr:hypothetical protein PHYBLDRAFT_171043 [Phycomyces blakesleeanus NRRL 1555(-)]OAD70983.1 hypothetical protein PHYBLDRAFT_171043 [Phycomyces blakesleeanus NRRL 1555(-)]|eukprot:XP_018289023.1 hypothetical protein PHYBLDRAFT_171043 [Phycomyces blakesleeanus NRRL 1555(-)]